MADDADMASLLPDPPPPRPAGRDAALAAAMRRFDGLPGPAVAPKPPPVEPRNWRPVAAFASVLLVAVISIPIALQSPDSPIAPRPAPAPSPARSAQAAVPSTSPAQPAREPRQVAPAAPLVQRQPAPSKPAEVAASVGAEAPLPAPAPEPAPPPPPPPAPAPAPPPQMMAAAPAPAPLSAPAVVARQGFSRASPAAASPSASADKLRETGDNAVVVTGTRVRRPPAATRRGDWNACTVDDPERSLRGCKRLVDPSAKGSSGKAGARLSAGLALAWQGEWDGAIAALDQAIALQPHSAFAYLNRGLAHQRAGDTEQAIADLDLAVRYAPRAARGYYHRSRVRRENGDARGAQADAARAVELDPRYEALRPDAR